MKRTSRTQVISSTYVVATWCFVQPHNNGSLLLPRASTFVEASRRRPNVRCFSWHDYFSEWWWLILNITGTISYGSPTAFQIALKTWILHSCSMYACCIPPFRPIAQISTIKNTKYLRFFNTTKNLLTQTPTQWQILNQLLTVKPKIWRMPWRIVINILPNQHNHEEWCERVTSKRSFRVTFLFRRPCMAITIGYPPRGLQRKLQRDPTKIQQRLRVANITRIFHYWIETCNIHVVPSTGAIHT